MAARWDQHHRRDGGDLSTPHTGHGQFDQLLCYCDECWRQRVGAVQRRRGPGPVLPPRRRGGRVHSLRQAVSTYAITSPCVRVYRFTDGVQQDIGFNSSTGLIDMAAAATFAGTSLLYVAKWYDQSGNGRDAVQASFVSMPQLFNFNGPQISFAAGSTLGTAAATGLTLTGDQTIGLFLQMNCNAASMPIECWDTGHGWAMYTNGNGAGSVDTIFDGSVGPLMDTSNLLAGTLGIRL